MDPQFLFELEEMLDEGNYEGVLEHLEEIGEEEMNSEYRFVQATALYGLGRSKEALSILQNYYEEPSEDDLRYHLLLAQIYYDLFEFHAAIREAQICLKINDNVAEVWFLLFSIYEVFGLKKSKDHAFRKALEADEEYVDKAMGLDDADSYPDYSPLEASALSIHINAYFGSPALELPARLGAPKGIKVLLIPASFQRDYLTLLTVGAGTVPSGEAADYIKRKPIHRAEFAAIIPTLPDLKMVPALYGDLVDKLRSVAAAYRRGDFFCHRFDTVSDNFILQNPNEYNGFLLDLPFPTNELGNVCLMPEEKNLGFYLLKPLYESELYYAKVHGGFSLLARMKRLYAPKSGKNESLLQQREQRFDVFHRNRIDTCKELLPKNWIFALSAETKILDRLEADLCLVSNLIAVQGERITFMYREKPDPAVRDSGWRFLSGKEDKAYLSDLSHADVFRLNTIANFDVTIIEYLNSPPGSAFIRIGDGFFIPYKRS